MRTHMRWTVLLAGELLVIALIAGLGDLRAHVYGYLLLFALAALLYLPAAIFAMQARVRLRYIILAACALRLPLFFTQPSLSDDVWRYLHDGRAQIAGVNPYAYAPADPRTAPYRGPEFDRINHPQLPTIYPPLAQFAFRVAALFQDPLLAWRLMLLAAEITLIGAGALLLRGRGAQANLALYAWHPLAIVESIGSAHLEPVGAAFMILALALLARARFAFGGLALAASVATKIVAAPILAFTLHKRTIVAFVIGLAVVYLPFALSEASPFGSLGVFAQTWASNGSISPLLSSLVGGDTYRMFALAALLAGILFIRKRTTSPETGAAGYFMLLFALSPVVHPWYLLWLLALLPLRTLPFDAFGKAALIWTVTVACAYIAHQQQIDYGVWQVPTSWLLMEYVPVYLMLGYAARGRWPLRIRAPRFS